MDQTQEQPEGGDPFDAGDLVSLRRMVITLRQQVEHLSAALKQQAAPLSLMNGAFPSIFPASMSGTSFTEKSVAAGTIVDRPAPARSGTALSLDSGDSMLLSVRDMVGGQNVMTYVEIGGSGGVQRVRLVHTGDDVYSVYPWSDVTVSGDPLATGKQPGYRPFGTDVDIVTYANYGIGWTDSVEGFYVALAIGEKYDSVPCPEPP